MKSPAQLLVPVLLLPALVEAEEPRVEGVSVARGETLRVTIAGNGAPVVLVPSLLASAFCYRDLLPRLQAAGYQAIVVEPLGVGGSARPERADYSLTSQADRLGRTLDALEVAPAVLVAHGAAASIALRLACRRPERVAAVVSLDGGPVEAAATPGFRRALRFAPLIRIFGGLKRIRGKVRASMVERSADARWVTDAVVDGYMAAGSADLGSTLRAYKGMAAAREPELLAPRLREVRCPVLLLVGGHPHEGGIGPAEVELLRAQLASFAVERVPGVGHFIFEENPAAVVAAVESVTASTRHADGRLP